MKRNALLIPFIIFLIIAAALLWQLARNAQGDDPTNLESALIGKPVPTFRLESLENPGQGNPYSLSLFDGDGMLGLDLGVYGAPETFLIDGKGIIRYRHAGDLNARVWESEIKPLWDKYSKEAAQ